MLNSKPEGVNARIVLEQINHIGETGLILDNGPHLILCSVGG
jgi:hypothetical protein